MAVQVGAGAGKMGQIKMTNKKNAKEIALSGCRTTFHMIQISDKNVIKIHK